MTDKKVECHLDPVLVGDFDDEMNEAIIQSLNLPKKFCVIYSYYNRIYKEDEIISIKNFCKKYDLEIISVGSPQMWIKKHFVTEPFQMLKVFQQADFVITDTFHGTIFSVKYARKFAVLVRESNKNKLSDLIKRLQLENHLVDSFEDLSKTYDVSIDRERVLKLINIEKNRTLKYLSDNLVM